MGTRRTSLGAIPVEKPVAVEKDPERLCPTKVLKALLTCDECAGNPSTAFTVYTLSSCKILCPADFLTFADIKDFPWLIRDAAGPNSSMLSIIISLY